MSDVGGNEAGWKPDPDARHEYRYWDGSTWTDQVSDGGVVATDPPGPAPTTAVPVQEPTAVVPPAAGTPPPYAAPYPPGAPLGGVEPSSSKSKVPVGVLALVGLVVAALVAGIVIVATGGDDSGSDNTDVAVSDSNDTSDDVSSDTSDDLTDDTSDDSSDDFTVDFSDDFSDDLTDDATTDPGNDEIAANNLQIGDCVEDQATLNSADVSAIDCGQPHVFELIGRFDVTGDTFPGSDQLDSQGQTQCTGQIFEDYVGVPYPQSEIYASGVAPSEETWAVGDRTILCFAHTQALDQTTGTVLNANR